MVCWKTGYKTMFYTSGRRHIKVPYKYTHYILLSDAWACSQSSNLLLSHITMHCSVSREYMPEWPKFITLRTRSYLSIDTYFLLRKLASLARARVFCLGVAGEAVLAHWFSWPRQREKMRWESSSTQPRELSPWALQVDPVPWCTTLNSCAFPI